MVIVIDEWPLPAPRTSLRSSLGASGENQRIDIVCVEGIVALALVDIVFGSVKRAVEIHSVFVVSCTPYFFTLRGVRFDGECPRVGAARLNRGQILTKITAHSRK